MNTLERLAWQKGLRIHRKRRAILQILDSADAPLSAKEIHETALRLHGRVSLGTIYLTLRQLVAAGLLTPAPSPDRCVRYGKAHSAHTEQLIDVRTGQVRDFRSGRIAALLKQTADRLGYRLLDYRLELFGTAECAAPATRPRAAALHPAAGGTGSAKDATSEAIRPDRAAHARRHRRTSQ